MISEMLKLNKQIIFSKKTTHESRIAAVMDMWENGDIQEKIDQEWIHKNVILNTSPWYKYRAIEGCVLSVLGQYTDPNYDPDDIDHRTLDQKFDEEMKALETLQEDPK